MNAERHGVQAHDRRSDVQGLRGVAVVLVILFHAGLGVHGGFTGVDVFFVISGFVITRMLLAELIETGTLRLLRFYERRVKRLLPALALLVAVVAVAGTLFNPFAIQSATAKTGIAASLFGANAYLYAAIRDSYFNTQTALDPLLHTWTLAVEEQFYVVFPTLLLLAWRRGRGRSRSRVTATWVLGAVAVVSFALSLAFSYGRVHGWPRPSIFAFYSSPTRAWEFAAGALVALAEPRLRALPGRLGGWVAAAGLLLVLAGALGHPNQAHFPGVYALLPVLGTAAAIAGGTAATTPATRWLETRPATWVGDRSYSWYLWHWPFIVDAKALFPGVGWAPPLAAAASIVPTMLSYSYVENPIRFNRRITGRRVALVGAVSIAAAILACGALTAVHSSLASTSSVEASVRALSFHADFTHGCMNSSVPLRARLTGPCAWPPGRDARGVVVLAGDSNAGHFSEPVIAAANQLGYTVVAYTASDCPFVLLSVYDSFTSPGFCRRMDEQGVADLIRLRPALVVIANRTDGYLGRRDIALGNLAGTTRTHAASAKRELWVAALARTLRRLNAARVPVLLFHPTPLQPGVRIRACAVLGLFLGECNRATTRLDALTEQRAAVRVENAAAARAPLTTTYSPLDALCTATLCPVRRNGVDLYFDPNHLSVAGARTLTGDVRRALHAALAG